MSQAALPGATVASLQRQSLLDPVDNRILLCHALGLSRMGLITQSERTLTEDEAARLSALIARRLAGEPVAYLIGRREFYGLDFAVDANVLIPRPETELLVELALERLPPRGRVLDMGTGSGAIAVALAHTRPDAAVTALDVSAGALAVAGRNAASNGATVRLLQSDWFGALQDDIFDLIVSNPPYIASGDRHLSEGDLRFEPAGALTDHADGLSALRRIVGGAPAHLVPGGWLLMEHGYDQSDAVQALLTAGGWQDVQSWHDLAGIARVTGGRAALR
ncbi:peptide chain release factor N(5)-glutamine methyltransferase [Pseudoduganella buxea]|uniref:Release factor glutamine methyltransferase n=1 Tax=Pseudoduganella buxea TaxID=1949069 RepID=A0A6I3SQP8_9BURK|nr:peptide chain release factor N(5)-glutamine methyltransferase [Pseudoduganella buxea]MTV51413.1 peptide chain release factor N(5)-glutamine methyltransferase [Pseudoduganella buxea]GGC10029.1 release factor glutamine methyltransferase [Pseudoduganella buxea]